MATIPRFMKNTVPKLAGYKFLIYDSPLHDRVFKPYDRRLCSKVFGDDGNEVLTNANPELYGRMPKDTKLNGDYNYSSNISSKKCSKISPFSSKKEYDKYNYFPSYLLAKKLGEVESFDDFVYHKENHSVIKEKNNLLNVPLACKHFNNCQFPNEKSMHNWIKAVDFSLQHRWITSCSLSIGLFSFAKLLTVYQSRYDKLMLLVGSDRLTTWFEFALEENCSPSKRNASIRNCVNAAGQLVIPAASYRWKLDSLYSHLNYSLSTNIPAQLKDLKNLKDHAIYFNILEPIIKVEVNFDQPGLLEQETRDEVVNLAIQFFHYYAQFMEKQESMSEDPRSISKLLQSLLLVLLKSNVDPNFIRNDINLAKHLAEKIKPVMMEKLRANGLKFFKKEQWTILMRHAMEGLRVSKSPFFANEELKEIISFLDPKRFVIL
uniref:Uncharacterized protein n=1 Tax=Romanomermis culicivorax TaxID=13658 RepID=A0A915JL75_ROMCU